MSALPTSDENLTQVYSSLQTLLHNLQTTLNRHSLTEKVSETPSFHTFFLTHLPHLLTPQKENAIYKLRIAYMHVTYLSSFAEEPVRTRCTNFCSTLLWALDHLDHLIHTVGEAGELEVMKAVRIIFHLVASLCYREWEIDQHSVVHSHQLEDHVFDVSVPSMLDPVYHPVTSAESRFADQCITNGVELDHVNHVGHVRTNLDNTFDDGVSIGRYQPLTSELSTKQVFETSESVNFVQHENINQENGCTEQAPRPLNSIRNKHNLILPDAQITETEETCHIPFDIFMLQNSEDDIR